MTIKTVTLVGANGKLGRAILHALVLAATAADDDDNNNKLFAVTVLSRASSTSTTTNTTAYPPGVTVTVTRVPDSFPHADLVAALRGQDALVVAFAGSDSDQFQIRLADAAAEAGVQRFIPADFGSCDSSSERALRLVPSLYQPKRTVRRHLQQLATSSSSSSSSAEGGGGGGAGDERSGGGSSSSSSKLTWTSLVCGHFFDFGLASGLLGFDLQARTARIFDGGDVRWSTSTLATIADAVVAVLRAAGGGRGQVDETRNRMLYIQSFRVSQNEVLGALQRATTTTTTTTNTNAAGPEQGQGQGLGHQWRVEHVDSELFIREAKARVDADPGDAEAREELVGVLGTVDADWEAKGEGGGGFANRLLGLEGEDLDRVVARVVGGGGGG